MEGRSGSDTSSRRQGSSLSCWEHLTASLDAMKGLDDYSSMKPYPSAPFPGLRVKNTLISPPLSNSAATFIKKLAKQATVGDESQKAINVNHHVAWELSTDQFDILNPAWPSFLDTILDDIRPKLGITGTVVARLRKLVLCEQGSHFKSSTDSAEEESKVAELLICLPSMQEGGRLQLSQDCQYHRFDLGKLPQFATAALSWPSGVTYELGEIDSGHLLVLSYSLVRGDDWKESKEFLATQADPIDHALLQCRRQFPEYLARVYLLDHKYLQTELALPKLKGRDRAICESLKRLCSQHGLYLFLGHCGNRVDTGCENDTAKARLFLASLNTLDGTEVAMHRSLSEDQTLNSLRDKSGRIAEFKLTCGTQRELDKGYDTAIIICQRLRLVSYLKSFGSTNWPDIVTMVMDDLDTDSDSNIFLRDSLVVLEDIVNGRLCCKLRPDVIQWAWKRKYLGLYFKLVRAAMQDADHSPDMSIIAKIINDDNLEGETMSSAQWDNYFGDHISRIRSLEVFSANLDAIKDSIRPDLRLSFQEWQLLRQKHALDHKETLGAEDEGFIRRLVLGSPENWVSRRLIPALKERGKKTLIRSLVTDLLSNDGAVKQPYNKDLASKILQSTGSKAALELSDFQPPAPGRRQTGAESFLRLISNCLKADLVSLGAELLEASWAEISAQHTSPNDFPLMQNRSSVADFLKLLGWELSNKRLPTVRPVRNMFKLFIHRYMHVAIPLYPKKLPGLDNIFERDVEAYKQELLNFERPFKGLRTRYIQVLLHDADYRELVMLENVKDSEGSKKLATFATNAGQKRYADETETAGQKMMAKRTRKNI
ncbi:hypothetical protein F5Y03DRAFT_406786 [Xylaria venustula]|nr:hypothetical protein F5Y03DRAFT_406786 [Xylaria venustula]